MTDKSFDWSFLFQTDNQALRADITNEDYERDATEFIQFVSGLIGRELMRIGVDAQSQADVYWEQNRAMRETGEKKEQGRYGTRVRLKNSVLTLEWFHNPYRTSKSGKKKPPLSQYIRKGRASYRYPKGAFADAKNTWEEDLIEQIEDRYAIQRIQASMLSEMRNLLRKYKTIITKSYGTTIEK